MAFKMLSVVGARPNFMKIAAIVKAVQEHNCENSAYPIDHLLVHTGQHYDTNMSELFFSDLSLPRPNVFLGVGSGSHSLQTAKVMERFENVLLSEAPDVVLVVGDVNSTVACALVTKKSWCTRGVGSSAFIPKLAHVEAGLRSFDRSMPEEVNRIVTDAVSDYLFTTEESANDNLRCEGIPSEKIHFVGNVMIDTLLRHRAKAEHSTILGDLKLAKNGEVRAYAILTLHRPANVDDPQIFAKMLQAFLDLTDYMPIIFPAHPRTLKQIQQAGLQEYFVDHVVEDAKPEDRRRAIHLVKPLGYLDFLQLMSQAKFVLTDSGGVQEETTILGVPCITLRDNTERPVTLQSGTNMLVGSDPDKILKAVSNVLQGARVAQSKPPLWDGQAARRIVEMLLQEQASATSRQIFSSREVRIHKGQCCN